MPSKSIAKIKMGLYNVENLFLLFDQPVPENLKNLSEVDWQKLSTSVYDNKPLAKCKAIANIIQKNSPDIMMFCEVGGAESLKNFNDMFLNSEYFCALIEGNSNRHIDVGFLIKKSAPYYFDLVTNKTRPLNFLYPHEITSKAHGFKIKADSHTFSRDCAELRLFTTTKDKPFLILLLTHLKSRLDPERIDPGGTERRAAELKTLIDIYNELALEFPGAATLVCGDLNGYAGKLNPDLEFLPIYQKSDLEDIFEIAGVSLEKRSTYYQIKNSSKIDGRQIDYCFLPKKIWAHLSKVDGCFVQNYTDHQGLPIDPPTTIEIKNQLPSDHYPLFFTLENISI